MKYCLNFSPLARGKRPPCGLATWLFAAAFLLSAAGAAADDDLPWKMEGSIARVAASECASTPYSDFVAHEVTQGASAAFPDLVRNEWTSALSMQKELGTQFSMVIIIR